MKLSDLTAFEKLSNLLQTKKVLRVSVGLFLIFVRNAVKLLREFAKFFVELIDATSCVNKFLLTSEKRV